jgi:hypothetical protein
MCILWLKSYSLTEGISSKIRIKIRVYYYNKSVYISQIRYIRVSILFFHVLSYLLQNT